MRMTKRTPWAAGLAITVVALTLCCGEKFVASQALAQQSSPSAASKKMSLKDAIALLKKGTASVAAKKPKRALPTLDRAISSGRLRYRDMAQALYQRGLAHRLDKNTPKAIEDLTAAVWIRNGLSADDRKAALAARTEAYAEAGLTRRPGVASAPAPSATPPTAIARTTPTSPSRSTPTTQRSRASTADASTSSGWNTSVNGQPLPNTGTASAATTDPLAQVGNGIQNFFGNLFSGVSQGASATPATGSINRSAPKPAAAEPATSGWSSATTTTARTNSTSVNPLNIQVAAVRGQNEARAIATKVNRSLRGSLTGQSVDVRRVNVGNMGALYRVEVGPFATERESRPTCAALRRKGYDCLILR